LFATSPASPYRSIRIPPGADGRTVHPGNHGTAVQPGDHSTTIRPGGYGHIVAPGHQCTFSNAR